ncbi:MAG: JAB domain-containing protein, partial [Oscillospiraceae bacterium]
ANATGIIIAHNHPNGYALPSQQDIATTEKIKNALELISVQLIDHIVVSDDDYVSFAQSGMI